MVSKGRNKITVNTLIIYLVFIFFGLNVKLAEGMYIYNILIFIYIFLGFQRLTITLESWSFIFLIITFATIAIGMDSPFNNIQGLENFIIPIKAIIFLSFLLFVNDIVSKELNYNLLLTLISAPVFLSVAMYHINAVSVASLSFYGVEKYEGFSRYGGTFGKDVNSLGMFSSLTLVLAMILRKLQLVKFSLSLVVIVFSLYAVALSGMRVGLLVFLSILFILNNKLKVINYIYLLVLLNFITIFGYVAYISNEASKILLDSILERFSLSVFLSDLDYSGNGGNLNHMILYFNETVGNKEVNLYQLLFGVDSNINFVDNFYVNVFLKHGLIFMLLNTCVLLYYIIKYSKQNNLIYTYFLIATSIIAVKGTFIFGNFYMFLVLFASHVWTTYDSHANGKLKN